MTHPLRHDLLPRDTSSCISACSNGVTMRPGRACHDARGQRANRGIRHRERVIGGAHDTFVQTLQGSKLLADDALDPSTDQEHMRRALARVSVWIGQAMLEAQR
jgi:hypothetical protein